MIVVTGGAGFIGSAFIWKLNEEGIDDILIVDELCDGDKWKNLVNRRYREYLHKHDFLAMIREDRVPLPVDAVIHMGACSTTTERDADYLMENNYRYSVYLAEWALRHQIRFIYASSAATYGDGSRGFSDEDAVTHTLRPINMYGYSKHLFDLWVIRRGALWSVAGVKFFNVFGPNEYHKEEMASIIFKAYHQISRTGRLRLFKSYLPEYGDGGQMRDFVYVKDAINVLWWLLQHREVNGIFNLGTGQARSWNDLAKAVFAAMEREVCIDYIEMPEDIRDQYQYFTEAKIDKLRACGCPTAFHSLEEAVSDYICRHLQNADPFL